MASALQRMLSEPKNEQRDVKEVNKFIVLNHQLSSYIATLVATLRQGENRQVNPTHIKIIRKALYQLCEGISVLRSDDEDIKVAELRVPEPAIKINEENVDSKLITEQLEFINKVSGDLFKICQKIEGEATNKISNTPMPESNSSLA